MIYCILHVLLFFNVSLIFINYIKFYTFICICMLMCSAYHARASIMFKKFRIFLEYFIFTRLLIYSLLVLNNSLLSSLLYMCKRKRPADICLVEMCGLYVRIAIYPEKYFVFKSRAFFIEHRIDKFSLVFASRISDIP